MTAEFPLAVHALVLLLHKGTVTSSQTLAENICTNPARVRKVMAKLCRRALVESERGQSSGYLTRSDADRISLAEVLSALGEEPVAIGWRSGDMDRECMISSGMGAIMDGIYGKMNEKCEEYLKTVTIGSINETIFNGQGGKT